MLERFSLSLAAMTIRLPMVFPMRAVTRSLQGKQFGRLAIEVLGPQLRAGLVSESTALIGFPGLPCPAGQYEAHGRLFAQLRHGQLLVAHAKAVAVGTMLASRMRERSLVMLLVSASAM